MEHKNNADIQVEDYKILRIKEEPLHSEEITTESQTSHVKQNDTKSNPKQSYTCLGTGTTNCDEETDIKGECIYQDEVSSESQKLNLQQIETHFIKCGSSSDVDTKVGIKQEVWDPNDVSCDPLLGIGSTKHNEVDIKEELWCSDETSADSLNETEVSGKKKHEAAEDEPLLLPSRSYTDTACLSNAMQLEQNINNNCLSEKSNASTEKCETNHRCKTCGKTFKLWSHLLKHNLVPNKCKWRNCDKNCTYSEVRKDCVIHNHIRQYMCDICGKTFLNLKHFKLHFLIHDETRQCKCQICDKIFKRANDLKRHLLVHDDKRQYKCNICGKGFNQLTVLKRHILVHDDKRRYNCQICGKSFKQPPGLKLHLLVHDDKGSYKCQICEKHFKHLRGLKSHLLVHDDQRKFKCQICAKTFKQLRGLKLHLLVHDDKRPYKCHICEKSFKQSSHFKKHLLVHDDKR